jgi:hypothetical protein
MLFFLAEGIDVPERDTHAGKVAITRHETGELFDWRAVTGNLLRVHVESTRPPDAVIAVRYRGSWFYIDDADLSSKSTSPCCHNSLRCKLAGRSGCYRC